MSSWGEWRVTGHRQSAGQSHASTHSSLQAVLIVCIAYELCTRTYVCVCTSVNVFIYVCKYTRRGMQCGDDAYAC